MKSIAIITARSGSKGLPDKNIRLLNGVPLIAYTIKAALDSGCFDTVMVSTDSEKYAQISREYGAEVPFLRSPETSSDTAGSWDVVREVLRNYKAMGKEFDRICLLQPTSPLRDAQDLRDAFAFMQEHKATNLLSCTELGVSVFQTYKIKDSFNTADIEYNSLNREKYVNTRRQDLPKDYRTNGAIYIVDKQIEDPSYPWTQDNCYLYVMPKEKSVDVDSLLDFEIVKSILDLREAGML